MTVTNIIAGLQLIQKSKPEKSSDYHLRADHDEIWAGDLDWMPEDDKKRMEDLGWIADDDANGWRATV